MYLFMYLNNADLFATRYFKMSFHHGKRPGKSLRKLCLEKTWKPVVAFVVMSELFCAFYSQKDCSEPVSHILAYHLSARSQLQYFISPEDLSYR